MSGVPDGIRVIDFGQYLAGPLAALLLADQGAAGHPRRPTGWAPLAASRQRRIAAWQAQHRAGP